MEGTMRIGTGTGKTRPEKTVEKGRPGVREVEEEEEGTVRAMERARPRHRT